MEQSFAGPGAAQRPVLPARPPVRRWRVLRELAETLVLIAIVYTIVNLATVRFFIEGPSMQPSFQAGQFLVVSRLSYLFAEPQRGEIVVFDRPDDDYLAEDPLLIKRIIGLPGDTIEFRAQQLYINGELRPEPYINEPCEPNRCRDNTWTLGPGQYFMMGDNRNDSSDSRVFGAVNRDRLVGQAIFRYWPLPDFGSVWHYRFPDEPAAG
jgi:signal peptidase I